MGKRNREGGKAHFFAVLVVGGEWTVAAVVQNQTSQPHPQMLPQVM